MHATGSSATAARRFSANRAAISKGFAGRVDRAEAELCCPSFGEGSGKRLFKLRQAGCSGLGFFCLLSSFTRAACLCYNVMFGLCFTCVLFIIACSTFVLIIFVFILCPIDFVFSCVRDLLLFCLSSHIFMLLLNTCLIVMCFSLDWQLLHTRPMITRRLLPHSGLHDIYLQQAKIPLTFQLRAPP